MSRGRTGPAAITTIALAVLCTVGTAAPAPGASLKLLVPAYANPCCDGGPEMWTRLVATAAQLGPDLVVIFNPASGPGVGQVDPNYVDDQGAGPLVAYRSAGGVVLGYVATSYATRSLAAVEADVDLYYDPAYWRGAGVLIEGIFFDEMADDLADVGYYRALRDHVHGLDAAARVVGNPGVSSTVNPSGQTTWTVTDYAESADTLVTFEEGGLAYRTAYEPPSWLDAYPADRFAHLVHTEPGATTMRADLSLALARKAGFAYVTDDVMANPYDLIPTYWASEVDGAVGLLFADGFESGTTSAWSTATR
jgi:hypothetical protein